MCPAPLVWTFRSLDGDKPGSDPSERSRLYLQRPNPQDIRLRSPATVRPHRKEQLHHEQEMCIFFRCPDLCSGPRVEGTHEDHLVLSLRGHSNASGSPERSQLHEQDNVTTCLPYPAFPISLKPSPELQ